MDYLRGLFSGNSGSTLDHGFNPEKSAAKTVPDDRTKRVERPKSAHLETSHDAVERLNASIREANRILDRNDEKKKDLAEKLIKEFREKFDK